MLRLTKTLKITLSATLTALSVACLYFAFLLNGFGLTLLLYCLSGIMLLLTIKCCGNIYGVLSYLAVGGISFAFFPYGLPYVLLFGLAMLFKILLAPLVRQGRRWSVILSYVLTYIFYTVALVGVLFLSSSVINLDWLNSPVIKIAVASVAAIPFVIYDRLANRITTVLTASLAKKFRKQQDVGGKWTVSAPTLKEELNFLKDSKSDINSVKTIDSNISQSTDNKSVAPLDPFESHTVDADTAKGCEDGDSKPDKPS